MATETRPLKRPIKPILSEEQKKALADKIARKKKREGTLTAKLGDALKVAFKKLKK